MSESSGIKTWLRVTMPDGSKWEVPIDLITELYIEFQLRTHKEYNDLIDWAENNLNWSDISHRAVLAEKVETDFQEGWVNGLKEIISK